MIKRYRKGCAAGRLFGLLAIGLLLGGCALAPPFTRPEAPVPTSWPAGAAYREALPRSELRRPPKSPGVNFSRTRSCRSSLGRPLKTIAIFAWRP